MTLVAFLPPAIARLPTPHWFPADGEVARRLGVHQMAYRFRKPSYQIQLLKDLASLLPDGPCRVLDVGAGNGLVAEMIQSVFPGKTVVAVDVLNRLLPSVRVPFQCFDGQRLPFGDNSFDCAILCNVLHHVAADQRSPLIRDVLRVIGVGPLVIKDHLGASCIDRLKLRWLDIVGNAPFGGMVRASYLGDGDWEQLLADLVENIERLPASKYRRGLFGQLFPNELEICFRTVAVRSQCDV